MNVYCGPVSIFELVVSRVLGVVYRIPQCDAQMTITQLSIKSQIQYPNFQPNASAASFPPPRDLSAQCTVLYCTEETDEIKG